MKTNYHTHTTWCDGQATVAAMAEAALRKGFARLGFSSHAMLPGDPFAWPLRRETLAAYAADVRATAQAFASRGLTVLCGVEADYVRGACSPDDPAYAAIKPDYVIGSVHYVIAPDGSWVCVDESPQALAEGLRAHFGGDARAFVRAYFAAERDMALTCDFDIVAHPDLVRKFNGQFHLFDETASWYVSELEASADAFARAGKLVEVNTGAISRGWMDDAYPSAGFRERLRQRGVNFVLSSDAHAPEGLDTAFERFAQAENYVFPALRTYV